MKQTILIIATLVVSLWSCDTQAQTVIELNRQQFLDKVWNYETSPEAWKYQGTLPCVIDFNAKWCGPCRKMEPILENLALKYRDRIIIYKVDVDKEKELAALFGVSSIPAFLFCPINGEPQGTMGAYPAEEFEKIIRQVLLGEKTE
ncbi:MAG: thiol reductase thioredoxin [Bacteroidales bacterium]|nr:thiol reductase thioredoxin [Bacteroidales bacterium]